MEEQNNSLFPEDEDLENKIRNAGKKKNAILALILVVSILVSVFATYHLTAASSKEKYLPELKEKQETINQLNRTVGDLKEELAEKELEAQISAGTSFPDLELLNFLFEQYSYYADQMSKEEILTAMMKAYAKSTGDDYAEYFTDEEYEEFQSDSEGQFEGVGISVANTTLEVNGNEYMVFQVISIFKDSPASKSDLRVGDCIFAVKDDEIFKTLDAAGGYTQAIEKIRGEIGTIAEFKVFRKSGEMYTIVDFSMPRAEVTKETVSYSVSTTDPSVGIVEISAFQLTTPHQLKDAILSLQQKGIKKFIFDLRNNPGGDVRATQSCLSYFLQEGDLILHQIDRDGNIDRTVLAGSAIYTDEYESCSVYPEEVGIFAGLNMVLVCNENSASSAEIFAATLVDYHLATLIGTTTYGKGIIQSFIPLSIFGKNYSGYVKMTTYAYVTKRGVTYHGIGIEPDIVVDLSEEAKTYSLYLLPESLDAQIQTAIDELK